MTRFIEETPTAEWLPLSGNADGNVDLIEPPQLEYIDCIAPLTPTYQIPETRHLPLPEVYPDELTYNFVPTPAYFDGDYHLINNTMLQHKSGDGNLRYVDGHAYAEPAPTYAASLKTGDLYEGKVVLRFKEHLQFQDNSYVLFGPTTIRNNTYPLERNVLFLEDEFIKTVELGDYAKAGLVYDTPAWPPVVATITPLFVLVGPPINKINDIYVPLTPELKVHSTYNNGSETVYFDDGSTMPLSNYSSVVYDPQGVAKLHNETGLIETFDGKTLFTQDIVGAIVKGEVVYKGVKYWCKLHYKGKDQYGVTIIGPSTGAVNKALFASKRFNKFYTS